MRMGISISLGSWLLATTTGRLSVSGAAGFITSCAETLTKDNNNNSVVQKNLMGD